MVKRYQGPEGRAKPSDYVGWAPGNPSGKSTPSEIIHQTCLGCNHIFDGKCDNPLSGRTGITISEGSARCPKYES